ncbi:protein phyllopod [Drosophila mojavensis]|uniref:ZAD domain-containing protein n=1 Tax=Drosophila mojavensis TaxID=7230 RepID=B4KT56_DROMO|nr:protein phyllopod [Drosophila mojavensis]EDW09576.1 uncharacterized protein Dmoj_GI18960 [Drosophila mojavensis]
MSANNEAEPAAALAAAAASSSADAAAAASEYLKRTCLICGCQTNQAINIYEPRSGPNIVQLIQAKFKFQPLNEDKFLCFSCNNWLINWHSLQALNSNDAESQSRSQSPSAHMGNNSSSAGIVQQQQLPLSKAQPAKLRPVAQVRPQPQRQPQPEPQLQTQPQPQSQPQPQPPPSSRLPALKNIERERSARRMPPALSRRRCRRTSKQPRRRSLRSSCDSCKWRSLHKRSLAKVAQLQRQLSMQQQKQLELELEQQQLQQSLVKSPTYQRLPKPRVDGKVVAMFRRLGTTLSQEQTEAPQQKSPSPLNHIMSPVKRRPRWTRQLDEDEILLEFDRAIAEVLPVAKRRLSYQTQGETVEVETETEEEKEVEQELEQELELELELAVSQVNHQTELQLGQLQLPQGLSITLI